MNPVLSPQVDVPPAGPLPASGAGPVPPPPAEPSPSGDGGERRPGLLARIAGAVRAAHTAHVPF